MNHDVLIEIGCEELPPKALTTLMQAFADNIQAGLRHAQIDFGNCTTYCSPRRLALILEQVQPKQPDREQIRRGPAISAAFTATGDPTPALLGFAKSCAASIADLQKLETDKGAWFIDKQSIAGRTTPDVLPDIIQKALDDLPIAKRMRWANLNAEFVRPLRWLVVLWDQHIIPTQIYGVQSSHFTYGHRFHAPDPFVIDSPKTYCSQLFHQGKVLVDIAQRKQKIQQDAITAAAPYGHAHINPDLLDEVAALTEWPVALVGSFESRFLEVPQQALISTMQDNQKYFPIIDQHGTLQPYFIFIANLESLDPAQVIAGNERVIRPRFSDAEFFWQTDKKHPLSTHTAALAQVTFQHQLGSLADKSQRVTKLATHIAQQMQADIPTVNRAAQLAKCDLLTLMVQEFPELQGIMGSYYALSSGETTAVAESIAQHYWPRFAGDQLPVSRETQALALAERLDTLIGIFAIGEIPTGSKDPFSLRRAALGVLRILIECQHDFDLQDLVSYAATNYPAQLKAESAITATVDYITERLKAYTQDLGYKVDEFDAVREIGATRPTDLMSRLAALQQFRSLPAAMSLSAANKRIRNILRKTNDIIPTQVNTDLLLEPAEQQLWAAVQTATSAVQPLLQATHYAAALARLAELRESVDLFFAEVMVMADDTSVRLNRLSLLAALSALFLQVADLSALQTDTVSRET